MSPAPRGEARRAALVQAAAEVLEAGGFGAVSHRAVAAQAGLPLAATTYWFATLDDLLAAAVGLLAQQHLEAAQAVVQRQPSRPVGTTAAARRAVEVVLPRADDDAALLGLYERYVQAGRSPGLRPVVARWNDQVRRLLGEALQQAGHEADPALVLALVDGLAVTALAEGHDPRRAAVRGLARLLDQAQDAGRARLAT